MSGNISDQLPPDQNYLMRRLDTLERRIRELEAARSSEQTTVGRGGMVIQGGSITLKQNSGVTSAYLGHLVLPGGTPSAGIILYRHNGSEYFVLAGDPSAQFFAFRDEALNIVISDDAASGQGLATPYIPVNAFPTRLLLTAGSGESTVSGTFGPLWTIQAHKQHPRLRVGMYITTSDTTTTAEIRMRDANTGAILDGPDAIGAGNNLYLLYELIGVVDGAHLAGIKIEIDARRTAGAGTVYMILAYAEGIQS